MFDPGGISASASLADPPGSSVILAAVGWLEGTLLGSVATILAVIAISTIGFMMLAGRIEARRGLAVILGCFILFGAPAIVAGLRASLPDGAWTAPALEPAPSPLAELPPPPPPSADPYAGASVPPGR